MAIYSPGDESQITAELWDSIVPGAAAVNVTLFAVPKGTAGKTIYETNLVQASQVPLGQAFEVLAVGWNVLPDVAPADAIALSKGYWELVVSSKMWAEGHLFDTGGGSGLYYSSVDTGAAVATGITNTGFPVGNNLKQFDRAIPIQAGEAFQVNIMWPVAPGAIKIFFKLHGRLSRPVN